MKTNPKRKTFSKKQELEDKGPIKDNSCPYHATSLLLCACRIVPGRRPGTVGVIPVNYKPTKLKAA